MVQSGSIDMKATKAVVVARLETGLRAATEHAAARARHHAPVRAIFQRSPRGAEFNKQFKTIRSKSRYAAFLKSKERRHRVDVGSVASRRGSQVEALQQAAEQQVSSARLSGKRFRPSRFAGQRNSLIPVRTQGNLRVAGDFRRFAPKRDRLATIAAVQQRRGQAAKASSKPFSGESFLSNRGRHEVRTARRSGRRGSRRKSALFNGRIGGRLRGEITVTGPTTRQGTMWMYVESPTEYAVHQEFGTTHHRAQPFLRPALYESRNVLRFEVRKAVDKRSNSLPGGD